jgi:hypothetical protein
LLDEPGVIFQGVMMRFLIIIIFLASTATQASAISQYVCTIGGVYEIIEGKLVQRPEQKAIGKLLYINADSGEVTGYFGTDDWGITKLKRPEGMLTIETSQGVVGHGANRLSVSPIIDTDSYSFLYTKNWLYISGECSSVKRHS